MARRRARVVRLDPAAAAVKEARSRLYRHPMFFSLERSSGLNRQKRNRCPPGGWAVVTASGRIHVHPTRLASAEDWVYVLAHCLLHLGLGHLKMERAPAEWNVACDCQVARFLGDFKIARPPVGIEPPVVPLPASESQLYERLCAEGIPPELRLCGTAGPGAYDMLPSQGRFDEGFWRAKLADGIRAAVASAVRVAGGVEDPMGGPRKSSSAVDKARQWFVNRYPLLGSLASGMSFLEDPAVCRRMDISVAAVDPEMREVYISPGAGLEEDEWRFVVAHELLHVGLRHDARRQGRDAFLWNVACDYVINGWLLEMGIGELPKMGVLHDSKLRGMSAEEVYDLIVTDIRKYRKLVTLRGKGLGDILEPSRPDWWQTGEGVDLDSFYRSCLRQGLAHHEEGERGYLPAGLVEEIRALDQPPIPWDVELAQWFDEHFAPVEKRRSYARPSRRQSATPDIPRPSWVPVEGALEGRTFGVVLDTSGSMDRRLLSKALGAIASYSISRDVPAVRVVFCDAAAYDQGYMPPEVILDRVKVRGRGGTVLQPGIKLLEEAEDFPTKGPILIITDGWCDPLRIHREHAFLMPTYGRLPFVPKGKVFRIE